jgi:hypothetical protein
MEIQNQIPELIALQRVVSGQRTEYLDLQL